MALSTHARPLVLRFGAFGDMILMIPAFKLLMQRHGAPCDVVTSGGWSVPLLQRVPAVADLTVLTSRRAPYWLNRSQQRLVRALRARAAGPVYVFEPDDKPLTWLRRAGIDSSWVCTLRDFPRLPGEHILAQAVRLARATPPALAAAGLSAGAARVPDAQPDVTAADRRDCAEWLHGQRLDSLPLVLLQPGNKKTMRPGSRRRTSNVKYWPETHWAAVAAAVQDALPAAHIVICGTPAEEALAQDIVAALPPGRRSRMLVATAALPIPRLLALQERAHSMISVDTGPAHSAAAMGCPVVVLFTRHPQRSADFYQPVATTAPVLVVQPESTEPEAGLESIAPDTVIAAWRRLGGR